MPKRKTPDPDFLKDKNIKITQEMLQKITFNPYKIDGYQVDGRCLDLTEVDLKGYKNLQHICFDEDTKRQKHIENFFNPEKRLQKAKTPGLHIGEIHN